VATKLNVASTKSNLFRQCCWYGLGFS